MSYKVLHTLDPASPFSVPQTQMSFLSIHTITPSSMLGLLHLLFHPSGNQLWTFLLVTWDSERSPALRSIPCPPEPNCPFCTSIPSPFVSSQNICPLEIVLFLYLWICLLGCINDLTMWNIHTALRRQWWLAEKIFTGWHLLSYVCSSLLATWISQVPGDSHQVILQIGLQTKYPNRARQLEPNNQPQTRSPTSHKATSS